MTDNVNHSENKKIIVADENDIKINHGESITVLLSTAFLKKALGDGYIAELERQKRLIKLNWKKLDKAREQIRNTFYKENVGFFILKDMSELKEEDIEKMLDLLREFLGFE